MILFDYDYLPASTLRLAADPNQRAIHRVSFSGRASYASINAAGVTTGNYYDGHGKYPGFVWAAQSTVVVFQPRHPLFLHSLPTGYRTRRESSRATL